MNRSILIVMCDFIVLSVLSLSFGVAPADYSFSGSGTLIDDYTATLVISELNAQQARLEQARKKLLISQQKIGYMEGREQQLKRINKQLAKTRARMEFLQNKLDAKGNAKPLSKAEMQRQLTKELQKRASLKGETERLQSELEFYKEKYKNSVNDMAAVRQNLLSLQDSLAGKAAQLAKTGEDLEASRKQLLNKDRSLVAKEKALLKTQGSLKSIRGELVTFKQNLNNAHKSIRVSRMDLSYAKGRLSATEKELAETRSELERSRKVMFKREIQLSESQKRINDLKSILRSAVVDLSQAKSELAVVSVEAKRVSQKLNSAKEELIKTRGKVETANAELKQTKVQLNDVKEKLRSDAVSKYSDSAVKLSFNIKESRLLMDYENSEVFYLPEVKIGGKHYLIADLKTITGMFREITGHSKVYKLQYEISLPKGDSKQMLKKPLISLNLDNRVCLMEVPALRKQALKIVTYSQLKKRGIQNLSLFKYNTFGKGFCSLNGRVSLSFSEGDQYLYIRNSSRRTGEPNAEAGDFVITKQGDFVGVVVAVESYDFGKKQEAKCFIFPDKFNINNATYIPIDKPAGQKYYSKYSNTVEGMVSKIKKLDRKQRKRATR